MKIGDYVRFKNGEIEKIHSFAEKDNPLFNILINARYHNTNEIKKYGEPIDLIEVGDYVNGYLVKDIDYAFDDVIMNKKNARYVPYIDCNKNNYIDDIKSIVTKEQFERMEYKVGE